MSKPEKILYIDDEAMALKYFEKLVRPLAPVLTALSVEQGKQILQEHASEIGVLVSDQRMPGAHGNELLRYAREHHPSIVRMLTTAYSELGEAIEAINSGEIYRYITKPWDIESLRADLRNALELAQLRNERDGLVREKLMVHQQQLLAARISQIGVASAGFIRPDFGLGLHAFLDTVWQVGCSAPTIEWHAMDHADLIQQETGRSTQIGQLLANWEPAFGVGATATAALSALADALPGQVWIEGDQLVVTDRSVFTWALEAPPREAPSAAAVAWLAWQLWRAQKVQVATETGASGSQWRVALTPAGVAVALPDDWMADFVERIGMASVA